MCFQNYGAGSFLLIFPRLDSIGIGGFGHDFGLLKGNKSSIADAFSAFDVIKPSVASIFAFLLAPALPFLLKIPSKRSTMFQAIKNSIEDIADSLLEWARTEKAANEDNTDKSIIGTLSMSCYFLPEPFILILTMKLDQRLLIQALVCLLMKLRHKYALSPVFVNLLLILYFLLDGISTHDSYVWFVLKKKLL